MSVRDDFAIAIYNLRKANGIEVRGKVAEEMLREADYDLQNSNWFVFSDPLPFSAIQHEWQTIYPAIASGLVDLPFPFCSFAMTVAFEKEYNIPGNITFIVTACPSGPRFRPDGENDERWIVNLFSGPNFRSVHPVQTQLSYMENDELFWKSWAVEWLWDNVTNSVGDMVHALLGGALSILITPQVKRSLVTYKPKQQRIRASRGLPGSQITYIQTREWVDAALETKRRETAGGTHASPRPHLRRGHPRTLQDGRRIWIKPMIVGASGQHGVVKRDHYVVKTNAPVPV